MKNPRLTLLWILFAIFYWATANGTPLKAYDHVFTINAGTKVLQVAPQGADYKSIQAAVDAAEPGVEIVVENGTYTESIWIAKARLTLRSASKHGAKIVAPQKKDAFGLGEDANYITLDGFDITAPGGNGIQTNRTGIKHVLNHHTIVRNCHIHDCGGGGIQLNHGDYRTVEYNIVRSLRHNWALGARAAFPFGRLSRSTGSPVSISSSAGTSFGTTAIRPREPTVTDSSSMISEIPSTAAPTASTPTTPSWRTTSPTTTAPAASMFFSAIT